MSALADIFSQLQSSTLKMVKKNVTVSNFKAGLNKLDIGSRESFFNDVIFSEAAEDESFNSVWEKLQTYWSFLNITLLEHIIYEFGDEPLQFSLEDYVEKLMEFQCKIHLHDFVECSTPLSTTALTDEFTKLAVKLNRCRMEFKLDDLDEIMENVADKFEIPKFFLILKDVEISGDITTTWAVPSIIAASIREIIAKTDLRLFCKRHKITSLIIASEEYKYSTANIVTEVSKWCQEIKFSLPSTMTQLYTAYACKLMTHHLKEQGNACIIHSLEEIPADIHPHFLKLCKIAWESTVANCNCSDVAGDTLGLIQTVKGKGGQLTYFSHQTLQEFLSAYHIAQLPLKEQEDVVQNLIKSGDLKVVVKFYFGLTKHHEFTSRMISEFLKSDCGDLIAGHQWSCETSTSKAALLGFKPLSSATVPEQVYLNIILSGFSNLVMQHSLGT